MKHKGWVVLLGLMVLLSGTMGWTHGELKHKEKKAVKESPHWSAPESTKKVKNPVPSNKESIARGRQLYENDCVSCHGKNGQGDGPDAVYITPAPSNLAVMAGHHTDGDLAWKIKKGKGSMPAWEDAYSEEDIWHLVNYIQNLKK
jgi:mono/diheme cytochrome c family protein